MHCLSERLITRELREAYRACKGILLRQEILALDGSDKEQLPYSVVEHNCHIRKLQPLDENRYAVFLVHESEAISFSYERETRDPRVSHTLNISIDEMGNVLKSASVVYPRRQRPLKLTDDATWKEQNKQYLVLTENQFTPDIILTSLYRLRGIFQTKSYEVKGILPAKGKRYLTIDGLENAIPEIGYGDDFPPGVAAKKLVDHTKKIYLADDLEHPMPEGEMSSLGLLYESYQLVAPGGYFEKIFVRNGRPLMDDINHTMVAAQYVNLEKNGQWWIRSGRMIYEKPEEAKAMFYQPRAYEDAFGARTTVKYYKEDQPKDARYWMMVNETIDALGNTIKILRFNFRNLLPELVSDLNYNLSEALFDELGGVVATATRGKEQEEKGDLIDATVRAFLSPEEVQSFFREPYSPGPNPAEKGQLLLGHATTRFLYDYTTIPVKTATIARETHFYDLAPGQESALQYSFEYSGGTGNSVLKKIQAPAGPAWGKNEEGHYVWKERVYPRWIGNGRTVLNNKGKPVKQYEPYFSALHTCEEEDLFFLHGVSSVLRHDPLGRITRADMPDGTFIERAFDNWQQVLYDPNDTVLRSEWYRERITGDFDKQGKDPRLEKMAAEKAAVHANTPAIVYLDSLGRAVTSVMHNKWQSTRLLSEGEEYDTTRVEMDIKGNVVSVTDARGNRVIQYKYDLPGNRIYQDSMDSGQRWLLINAAGKPINAWDERNFEFRYFFDILQRPTLSRVSGGDGATALDNIFSKMVYGEDLLLPGRSNEAALRARNILGKPVQQYDTGGLIDTPDYDFQGRPLSATRRLFSKYKEVTNWKEDNLAVDLEAESFTSITTTDALGRIAKQTAPDGSVITPSYNETGLLNRETVLHPGASTPDVYIKDIRYNEKGTRDKIIYGNGVSTTFVYDKETFRLLSLKSMRQNGESLQDWRYTYDAAGNIVFTGDKNMPVVFFDNQKITSLSDYTYDALYRLIEASGRENDAALVFGADDNWNDASFMHSMNPGDPMATRNYLQSYQYDVVGNILGMRHRATGNNWTRNYHYEAGNNRLVSTQVGHQTYQYPCNVHHGFMTALPQLSVMDWNFKEELVKTSRQRRTDGGTPETTWYQYDGQGQRIRKLTEKQAVPGASPEKKEARIYIAGYEIYRKYEADTTCFERSTLSLLDGGHRFVMVETVLQSQKPEEIAGEQLTRYQLHNSTGSSALELDDGARVISYEEYHPFGTTAFQAKNASIKAAAKRYRYTGMERDEETGLEYHSARYYLPWLGRWGSADPIGIRDGGNIFMYCKNNPVNMTDVSGKQYDGMSANDIGMSMMWTRMGQELSADWESLFGGHAYINPISNVVDISAPTGGVGGMSGGVIRAATLRIVPIEDHPSLPSLYGMEMGAGLVPILDPAARLTAGTTVTGQETSRGWAGVQLAFDVLPFAIEFHAMSAEARMASMETRAFSLEGDALLDSVHIGATDDTVLRSTTNPTGRRDLCVADVGAHEANLRLAPGQDPVTNTEFVAASGREVNARTAPIKDTGEAINFLNSGFENLQSSGRITGPVRASIPMEPVPQPGNYLVRLDGSAGGHAIHATVTDVVEGERIVAEGRVVNAEEAAEIADEGGRVVRQTTYVTEYYDPQKGQCIMPPKPEEVRSWVRLQN